MMRFFAAWGAAIIIAGNALAADEELPFSMDMVINFDGNFVSNTWVPIDVFVKNDREDMQGHVEVRLSSGGNLQSPIYTVPAESPLGSDKRFRIYARLDNTSRVTAQFYNGRRAVLSSPVYQDISATSDRDLMGLLLTEDPADLGFLNPLLDAIDTRTEKRRLFRKWLHTENANRLPLNPLCYEPYRFLFIDEFIGERISPERRAAIERYVRDGGTLVLMTGAHASHHRDGWIAELAGVSIEAPTLISESELAKLFDEEGAKGLSPKKQYPIAPIKALHDDSRIVGDYDTTLAILRPYGHGQIITFAIDAKNKGLQSCVGYQALWGDILLHDPGRLDLQFGNAAPSIRQWLVEQAGIQMFSRAKVFVYLLTYFGVGIVGAWLVANAFRRRELAWVFMCLASVGFAAYALIFGTAGRATKTELERIEIVQMNEGSREARLDTILGIVSARTRTYDIPLVRQPLGVSHADYFDQGGFGVSTDSRPFNLVVGERPLIANYQIGASEVRLLRITDQAVLPGEFLSNLTVRDGEISGGLTNATGYELENPLLFYQDRIYMGFGDDEIRFHRHPDTEIESAFASRWNTPNDYYYYRFLVLRQLVLANNTSEDTAFLVAWNGSASLSTAAPEAAELTTNVQQSLVVASLPIRIESRLEQEIYPLPYFDDQNFCHAMVPRVPDRIILAQDWDVGEPVLHRNLVHRGDVYGRPTSVIRSRDDEYLATVILDDTRRENSELFVEMSSREAVTRNVVLYIDDPETGEVHSFEPKVRTRGSATDGQEHTTAIFKIGDPSQFVVNASKDDKKLVRAKGGPVIGDAKLLKLRFSRATQSKATRVGQEWIQLFPFELRPNSARGDFPAWP